MEQKLEQREEQEENEKPSIAHEDSLAEYVTPEEHEAHAKYARLVARFHERSAEAMRHRLAGRINSALAVEKETDRLAKRVERWEGGE